MIGRLYSIAETEASVSTAHTFVEIASAADSVTLLERAWMGQSSFDTSENLEAKIMRIGVTGTGTALVPEPFQVGDAAFGGVCEVKATIEPTYTAVSELVIQGFNVLSGWLWTPANDDEVIVVSPSALVGIKLDVAPSGAMNFSFGCTFREIGG